MMTGVALVGLPRSGTTAIHVALSRHPLVYGIFEFLAARPRSTWRSERPVDKDGAWRALSTLGPLAARAADGLDGGRFARLGSQYWTEALAGHPSTKGSGVADPAVLLSALRGSGISRYDLARWSCFPEFRSAAIAAAAGALEPVFAEEIELLRKQVADLRGTPVQIATALFSRRAAASASAVWLEKSPNSLAVWDRFPDVRVVYVERSPHEIARSLDGLSLGSLLATRTAATSLDWAQRARAVDARLLETRPPGSVLTTSLASWVADPRKEHARVCDFMGIPLLPKNLSADLPARS